MRIRCKLIREGGSKITIGETEYHFKPGPDGHIADVTVKDHVARFLAIPEGYELADLDTPKAPEKEPEKESEGAPDYSTFTRGELEASYAEKFGKAPHPNTKDETLIDRLTSGVDG